MTRWVSLCLLTTLACTGADGADGTDGADGQDGQDGAAMISLDADTTWETDQALPYIVHVPAEVTLTISGGVTVSLFPGGGLLVDGTLLLGGSAGSEVNFVNASTAGAGNFGVAVGGTGNASILDFASFEGVDLGVSGEATAGITGSSFADSTLMVQERTTGFTVSGCSFSDDLRSAGTALWAAEIPALSVTDSNFSEFNVGIEFNGLIDGATLTVTDCEMSNGGTAIRSGFVGLNLLVATISGVTIDAMSGNAISLFETATSIDGVTISNVAISGVNANVNSPVVINNATITAVSGHCIQARADGFSATGVDVTDCGGRAFQLEGDATLADVTITGTLQDGLMAERNLIVDGLTITGSGLNGLVALDGADLANVTVDGTLLACLNINSDGALVDTADLSNCGTDGIEVEGQAALTAVSVNVAGDDCLDANAGGLSIDGAVIGGCAGHGIETDGGATLANVAVDGTGAMGIASTSGGVSITSATVANTTGDGVRISLADLTATGVTVTNAGGMGIFVAGAGTLDGIQVSDTVGRGIDVGVAAITDTTVSAAGDTGIFADSGSVARCAVQDGATDGIWMNGTLPSSVSLCNVSDNARYGVRQNTSGSLSVLDVTANNIVGNGDFGVFDARLVTDNFISDNRGQVGADTGSGGVLDGVRNTDTPQVDDADRIETPLSVARTDTGPQ